MKVFVMGKILPTAWPPIGQDYQCIRQARWYSARMHGEFPLDPLLDTILRSVPKNMTWSPILCGIHHKHHANQTIVNNETTGSIHRNTADICKAASLPRDTKILDNPLDSVELLSDRSHGAVFNTLSNERSQISVTWPDEAAVLLYLSYLSFQSKVIVPAVEDQLSFISRKQTRQRWEHGQEHKRLALVSWFAEWPNGLRPLSTTWPWNIRPSLVVLWGVCWMFYANVSPSNCITKEEFAGVTTQNDNNQSNFWGNPPQTLSDDQWLELFNPSGHDVQQTSESHLPQDNTIIREYSSQAESVNLEADGFIRELDDLLSQAHNSASEEDLEGLIAALAGSHLSSSVSGLALQQPKLPTHVTAGAANDVVIRALLDLALQRIAQPSLDDLVRQPAADDNAALSLLGVDNLPQSHPSFQDRHEDIYISDTNTLGFSGSPLAHQTFDPSRLQSNRDFSSLSYLNSPHSDAAKPATLSGSVNELPCAKQSGGIPTCASLLEPLSHACQSLESASNICPTEYPVGLSPYEYITDGSAPFAGPDDVLTQPPFQFLQNLEFQPSGMSDTIGYPSPRSEGPRTSPITSSGDEAKMDNQATANSANIIKPRLAVKRTRDPPKKADGLLFCDHPDCAKDTPIFRRPCEWNKHMDKHDRPYKCMDPECEKMQGFTYSGGLLRHQREVHKMHSKGKKLMCPFPGCNRSSGKGFTRQENLKEHLRRLHRNGDGQSPELPPVSEIAEIDRGELASPTKRKRDNDTPEPESEAVTSNIYRLREEVTRLRREAQDKDSRLGELEKVVDELRKMIKRG